MPVAMSWSTARRTFGATPCASTIARLRVDQPLGVAPLRRHDAEWTQAIRSAELTREADGGGFGGGAEVTRTAYFLGRRIDYVLRVAAYEPPTAVGHGVRSGPDACH